MTLPHHPTAIASTLTAPALAYPVRAVWLILEPAIEHAPSKCVAERAGEKPGPGRLKWWSPHVFKSEAIPEPERLDLAALAAQVQRTWPRARALPAAEVNGIVQLVAPEMRPGDVVAILSKRAVSAGFMETLPQTLESSFRKQS